MSMHNELDHEELVALLDAEQCAHTTTKNELKAARAAQRAAENLLKSNKTLLKDADKDRDAVEEKLAVAEAKITTLEAEKAWLLNRTMSVNAPSSNPARTLDKDNEIERLKNKIAALEMTASLQSATKSGQQAPGIFNFAQHASIGHVENLNITVQNNIIAHLEPMNTTTPAIEDVDADVDAAAESLDLSTLAIDDGIVMPMYKAQCTGCHGTKCPYLHRKQANKFSAEEIDALPLDRRTARAAKGRGSSRRTK